MIYSYVPSLVKCRIFGVELEGLSKESFVTIERINDVTTFRKAMDGSHTAFTDKFGDYRVTFNINQVSESNEFLHILFKLYQKVGINLKIPLEVEEKIDKGGTKFTAFDCFFENEASSEFTNDAVPKTWIFVCHNGAYTQRGTTDVGSIVTALQSVVRLVELSSAVGIDLSSIQDKIGDGVVMMSEKLKNLF